MDRKTTLGARGSAIVEIAVHAAVAVGVSQWVARRLEARSAAPSLDRMCHVERLVAAREALAEAVDRRLRSVEESAARAEAEARFTATLVGDHVSLRPAPRSADGAADDVERSDAGPVRPPGRAAVEGAEGPEARHVDG